MASWTGKKSNVVYSKPSEPSFLKKFKEKVGYTEASGVAEKFESLPKATKEDLEDGDDELPQVVQLNPGDISEEEYRKAIAEDKDNSEKDQEKSDADSEKIVFRKPSGGKKRAHEHELKSSTKRLKSSGTEKPDRKERERKNEKSNRSLLSFDDVDEDCS